MRRTPNDCTHPAYRETIRDDLRPDIRRTEREPQLAVVKKELQEWLKSSGEVTLEMELSPIIEQIDQAFL